ncbi:MAG: DUF1444 family protein [Phycisphaeraceae bacterium]|nr:DUF1444 family protein [Phycisphaerales bacterium]MCB9858928.1 DUF1444 family protein [Phycisphaeraceae bacterium]
MGHMPHELQPFAERVAEMLRKLQPSFVVELEGASELIIDGRRLDLLNLHRMVSHEPDRGEEIVGHYLNQLFNADVADLNNASFEFARTRIMPRIQPDSIFQHLSRELVAHVPYVNDTVIVFVIDLPQMTVSVTTEQMVRWGVSVDELDEIARKNLAEYVPQLEFQIVESKEGGRAAILSEQDGYDAARLLLPGLHTRLIDALGPNFLVAVPARDMFVALSDGPTDFLDRLHDRVEQDYERLPYPISRDFFMVTYDGVVGLGEPPIADAA